MVERFHEDGKDCFNYVELLKTFPNVKKHELKAALYNLQSDHLVSIDSYDNEPSITILDVKAISKIDEDTFYFLSLAISLYNYKFQSLDYIPVASLKYNFPLHYI